KYQKLGQFKYHLSRRQPRSAELAKQLVLAAAASHGGELTTQEWSFLDTIWKSQLAPDLQDAGDLLLELSKQNEDEHLSSTWRPMSGVRLVTIVGEPNCAAFDLEIAPDSINVEWPPTP